MKILPKPADFRILVQRPQHVLLATLYGLGYTCLLYTSDAADERSSVDLGGRRNIKNKTKTTQHTKRDKTEKKNNTKRGDR